MNKELIQKYLTGLEELKRIQKDCPYNEDDHISYLDNIWYFELNDEEHSEIDRIVELDNLKRNNKMKRVFESKEQYINFINKWKEIVKELKHKKKVIGTHYAFDPATRKFNVITEHTQSELSNKFHAIYLAATGKLPRGMKVMNLNGDLFHNLDNTYYYDEVYNKFGDTLNSYNIQLIEDNLKLYHSYVKEKRAD